MIDASVYRRNVDLNSGISCNYIYSVKYFIDDIVFTVKSYGYNYDGYNGEAYSLWLWGCNDVFGFCLPRFRGIIRNWDWDEGGDGGGFDYDYCNIYNWLGFMYIYMRTSPAYKYRDDNSFRVDCVCLGILGADIL